MKRLRNLSTPSHDLFPGFQRKRNRPEYVAINCRFDYFFGFFKKNGGRIQNSQNGTLGLLPFHLVLALVGAGFGLVHFARSDVPHQVEKHLQQPIKRYQSSLLNQTDSPCQRFRGSWPMFQCTGRPTAARGSQPPPATPSVSRPNRTYCPPAGRKYFRRSSL